MIQKIIIVLFLLMAVLSCRKENRWDCTKGTGKVTIEERTLNFFDSLVVYDNVEVFIHTDTVFKAQVEAGENLLTLVKTELNGAQLEIRNENTCNWVRSYKNPMRVTVFCPDLLKIVNYGTATVTGLDTIKTWHIKISVQNAGDLILPLKTMFADCSTFSSGDLNLSGSVGVLALWGTGTGWFRCANLETGYAFIDYYTSGDGFIKTTKVLGVRHYSEGNFYYSGNPWEVTFIKKSTGNLIKVD